MSKRTRRGRSSDRTFADGVTLRPLKLPTPNAPVSMQRDQVYETCARTLAEPPIENRLQRVVTRGGNRLVGDEVQQVRFRAVLDADESQSDRRRLSDSAAADSSIPVSSERRANPPPERQNGVLGRISRWIFSCTASCMARD
jgi:hypothetical protein